MQKAAPKRIEFELFDKTPKTEDFTWRVGRIVNEGAHPLGLVGAGIGISETALTGWVLVLEGTPENIDPVGSALERLMDSLQIGIRELTQE